jgi:branched-chain amino acid transport system substrate-binding protein
MVFFLGGAGDLAQATDKDAYKIGGIFPLTGYLSWLGEYYKKGAELQVELINKAGGVDGHPLKLISYDDKSSPENGSRVARRLISKDGVVALIGTATVPISGAVASVANKNKVPVLVSSGYAVDPKKEPYTFNTVHKTDYAVILPFKYFQKKGIKKLALLMTLGPLGELGSKVARKYAKDYGIEIVGEEKFDPKSPDLTAQLAKLRTLKPEAIFSFCTGEPAAKVARNMDQLGVDIPLLVSHGNGTPGFLKLVSGLKTKILVPSGKIMKPDAIPADDPTKKVIMDFHQKHKEKYKEPANYFSGMTADSVALIAKGLQKVGKADPQKLRDAIEATKNFARLDGVYNMSASDHYGTKPDDMILLIVKDGKWEAAK